MHVCVYISMCAGMHVFQGEVQNLALWKIASCHGVISFFDICHGSHDRS